MGCLNKIFKVWPDKNAVKCEKNAGIKVAKDGFRYYSILQALLALAT